MIDWLLELAPSERLPSAVCALYARKDVSYLTPLDEIATLCFLIERLQPQTVLEIGTFFAATSKIMAEALSACGRKGKLITLDPFGGHRVPAILQTWPQTIQAVTEFRPSSSMDYFLELESQRTHTGVKSLFGLIFVDGHHNLEYVLFDLIRSADHLRPDGVIVVDNLEQEGPRQAAVQFLHWNPAWSLVADGAVYNANNAGQMLAAFAAKWGVLVGPGGIQISRTTSKFTKNHCVYKRVRGVRLNVRAIPSPGQLDVNLSYYSIPYDFHLTGQGMIHKPAHASLTCCRFEPSIEALFSDAVELTIPYSPYNLTQELEVTFTTEDGQPGYLLLEAENPFELV
jgi:predicted O-methyltransferase YrrM